MRLPYRSFRWAALWAMTCALAPSRAHAEAADDPLQEIQSHFHATKKWFGMVSDLRLDRAKDGSLTPRFETLHSKFVLHHDPAGQTLWARLPGAAASPILVQVDRVDGFWVSTREMGVTPAPVEIHGGMIVYRAAVAGGDLLYKLTPTHVDEYVYFRQPPAVLKREFEFDTGPAVSMLRIAGQMVEVLGGDGVARLRLSAPLARAADGTRRRGTVRVEGQKIFEEIDLTGLVAPILVDPDWSTTGTQSVAHWADVAWRRPDDRVMVVGGCALSGCPKSFAQSACAQVMASTDVWDPGSGTWTAGPPMETGRYALAGVPLPMGDMLVAGGCTTTGCTATTALAERFSFMTGTWSSAGSLASPRANMMAAALANGEALIAGGCGESGCTADVERYDPALNALRRAGPLPTALGFATATLLADGRVLVAGGCTDSACATVVGGASVYDPTSDAWAPAGTMGSPRAGHSATLLSDGSVLIAGGCPDAACATAFSSTELWTADRAGGTFAPGPSMTGTRHNHTASTLASGEILIAGGADATGSTAPTSEVYLPIARQWVGTTAMLQGRAYHVGVGLADGKVLVAGGCNPATCLPWAEVFSPASLPPDGDAGVPLVLPSEAGGPDAGGADAGGADAGNDAAPAPRRTSPHPPLYRTGVSTCATETTQDLPCPVTGYALEDGDFQPNTQAMKATGADEVTDGATGLVWQRAESGQTFDQASAVRQCAALKTTSGPAGAWRLPSVIELITIVDYGVSVPSIDGAFKGTLQTNYWTATPVVAAQMLAWTVKFDAGEVIPVRTDTSLPVKCVRGASKTLDGGSSGLRRAGAFEARTDTVRDATTGLEWQRRGDGVKRSWKDSLSYCAGLSLAGESGWHLANVSELLGLVQFDRITRGVAIDPVFDETRADIYWTSSQNEGAPTLSWSVTFNLGVVDGVTVTGLGYARCVRHIDVSTPPTQPSSSCACEVGPGADKPRVAAGVAILIGSAALLCNSRRRQRRPGRRC